jgi:predicted nucleic acid-binding Zn ribbon protein
MNAMKNKCFECGENYYERRRREERLDKVTMTVFRAVSLSAVVVVLEIQR